ncbi:hypothetical protein Avbf_14395 [Armadillidium vulgare]|nr:hypothetical protein Avbf_14395 [Armadillidium vulgare]
MMTGSKYCVSSSWHFLIAYARVKEFYILKQKIITIIIRIYPPSSFDLGSKFVVRLLYLWRLVFTTRIHSCDIFTLPFKRKSIFLRNPMP